MFKTLEDRLYELAGGDADSVAEKLRKAGVREVLYSGKSTAYGCPVAVYCNDGGDFSTYAGGQVALRYCRATRKMEQVKLPPAVIEFAWAFGDGCYPDLHG